jgi:hypothetical protein
MRAPMKLPPPVASLLRVVCGPVCSVLLVAVFAAGLGAGCGKEIGDACVVPSDCSPNGDRQCLDPSTNDGYCTVQGCDFNTCPEEAVCVRFFTGNFANRECNPKTEDDGTDQCSFDELCSLTAEACSPTEVPGSVTNEDACGRCVARSSEIRFCMRTCESDDDCRDGYECRDFDDMKAHGGEPVLDRKLDRTAPRFCATAPI